MSPFDPFGPRGPAFAAFAFAAVNSRFGCAPAMPVPTSASDAMTAAPTDAIFFTLVCPTLCELCIPADFPNRRGYVPRVPAQDPVPA